MLSNTSATPDSPQLLRSLPQETWTGSFPSSVPESDVLIHPYHRLLCHVLLTRIPDQRMTEVLFMLALRTAGSGE
jgi:hypothetical protein